MRAGDRKSSGNFKAGDTARLVVESRKKAAMLDIYGPFRMEKSFVEFNEAWIRDPTVINHEDAYANPDTKFEMR